MGVVVDEAGLLSSAPDPLCSLVEAARQAMHCDGILVARLDGQGRFQLAAQTGLGHVGEGELEGAAIALDALAAEFHSDEPRFGNLAASSSWGQSLSRYGFNFAMFVPLRRRGAVTGVMVGLRSDHQFSDVEAGVVRAFAPHFTLALSPRPAAVSQSFVDLLRGLGHLYRHAKALDISDLCGLLDAALEPVLGTVRTGLLVWDEEEERLDLVSCTLASGTWHAKLTELSSSTVRVFVSGSPYVTDHAFADPGVLTDQAHRFGTKQLIQIRLSVAGRAIGVLTVSPEERSPFEDLEALEAFAPHLAALVDSASKNAILRKESELNSAVSDFAMLIAQTDAASSKVRFSACLGQVRRALSADLVALVRLNGASVIDHAGGVTSSTALEFARTHPLGVQQKRVDRAPGPGGVAWLHTIAVELDGERMGTVVAVRAEDEPFGRREFMALQRVANLAGLMWSKDAYWRQRVLVAKMEERERLANDLHDDVAQLLFAAHLTLEPAVHGLDHASPASVRRARELVASADEVIRKLINERTDAEEPQLVTGLAQIARQIECDYGIPINLKLPHNDQLTRVAPEAASALIRVAREAVVNAAKHANPSRVDLLVDTRGEDNLTMIITDDGAGAGDRNPKQGYGLKSMHRSLARHGGDLGVSFTPNGTTVTATIRISA
jgi:signal transduction histidine kinase